MKKLLTGFLQSFALENNGNTKLNVFQYIQKKDNFFSVFFVSWFESIANYGELS